MTRDKAVKVEHLLYKIECYEALLDELSSLEVLEEMKDIYTDSDELEAELLSVVQRRLDTLLKELDDM